MLMTISQTTSLPIQGVMILWLFYYPYLNFSKKTTPEVKTIIHNKYIFKVSEKVSAKKPIAAGIIIVEDNPIVIRFVTVIGILSEDCLTACLITIGTKLAMANP